jgi:hypothetical protein
MVRNCFIFTLRFGFSRVNGGLRAVRVGTGLLLCVHLERQSKKENHSDSCALIAIRVGKTYSVIHCCGYTYLVEVALHVRATISEIRLTTLLAVLVRCQ